MIHVFTGPTLPASEPQLATPDIRIRPPARHGDLFDTAIRPGDTVLIIDGLYHQTPALRHKEILAAIARGVHMTGAASIGALRAAELAPFGMLGIGSIYTSYARGEIHGDDEVAVGQAPDGEEESLTWPVVNLRHTLRLARAAGIVDGERAAGLLTELHAVYYPQRTTAAIRAVCRRRNETQFAQWLADQRRTDPHFGDLKRADALTAVRTALNNSAAPTGQTPRRPPVWDTAYYRRWSNTFAHDRVCGLDLPTEDRLIYQQVFDPAFPARWTAYLERRSLQPTDGAPGLPLRVRLAQVTGGLPAHRVFRPPVDLRDQTTLGLLLAGESEQDRQAVAHYARTLPTPATADPDSRSQRYATISPAASCNACGTAPTPNSTQKPPREDWTAPPAPSRKPNDSCLDCWTR
ncbi:hypothetical protein YW7DRAFT_06996 [Streptomyces sp. AmelKG-E11A]|nr:hypothetical protein YW7DRAFT_06996 [Streptomyces sp. AmelKG-E11A]